MGISRKINLIVTVIIVSIVLSAAISRSELRQIKHDVDQTFNENVEQVRIVDEIRTNIGMQGLYIRSLFIHNTAENQQLLSDYATRLDEGIASLQSFELDPEIEKHLEQIIEGNDTFNANFPSLQEALNQGDREKATEILLNQVKKANVQILESAEQILAIEDEILAQTTGDVSSKIDSALLISLISSTITFIVSIIVIIFIRKFVVNPLKVVMANANQIAQKDFTVEDLKMKSKDEIGQLATIFNEMKNTLKLLIKEIQSNAEHLQASSEELTASTEEITASSDEVTNQVSSAAKLAVGMSQKANESAANVGETVDHIGRIASSTNELLDVATHTSQKALDGVETITNAKNQMQVISVATNEVNLLVEKLSTQTAEIESISKVISAITDQTNLLALNASIEAARAGEHGKGFAVVADEVKKLANESKASAESIQSLTSEINTDTKNVQQAIEKALTSVTDGVKVITVAGESFETIVRDVQDIAKEMSEISNTTTTISTDAITVSNKMKEIAVDSEVAADGLGIISSAMEEQLATLTDVNHVSITVSENATQLQDQTKQFRV